MDHLLIDLTGQTFGKLKVLGLSKIQDKSHYTWDCLCECGNKTRRMRSSLLMGSSCGCNSKTKFKNLTGMRFNRFLVLYRVKDKLEHRQNRVFRIAKWMCLCDCGTQKIIEGHSLKRKNTTSCGCFSRESRRGSNSPRWNCSLSLKDREENIIRNYNPKTFKWRNGVFKRDNYTCQITGEKSKSIVAHHLESWNTNKKRRFIVKNGITLCKNIHILFHRIYGNGSNTKKQFQEFKKYYLEILSK